MPFSSIRSDGSAAVSPQPIAYGQLGILLELLWRGERTAFAKCDFCQTLNHRFATRCEACSGKLPRAYADARGGIDDAAPKVLGKRERVARQRRELTHLMLWVLAMPLALFVVFTLWQQSRLDSVREAKLHAPAIAAAADTQTAPEPAAASLQVPALVPEQLATVAEPRPEPELQARAQETVARPAPTGDLRAVPLAPLAPRSDRVHLASATPRADRNDPTAGCEGEMFLLRAICVNRRCADPQNATRGRCVEAVRQRRIEEARRNQTPMG